MAIAPHGWIGIGFGHKGIIRRYGTILIQPHHLTEMAAAILRLLADPALGRGLARAASQRLGEEYDLDRVVQDHVRLYERLAAPGASR